MKYIDISVTLMFYVYNARTFSYINPTVTQLVIPNWTCNKSNNLNLDFSRFNLLESIEIGNDCFEYVKSFLVDGLNRLKTINIGKNSFTKPNNNRANGKSKSFHILNCESLESIEIGERSFSNYAGEFELKNLPQLQSIQIGTVGRKSYNFSGSSFVIRGINMTLNN